MSDEQCVICGEDFADEEEHDHSADAVVIRDGWRGQYLAPTEVLDIADLIGEDRVPKDVRDAADRWLAEMWTLRDELLEGDCDAVLDWLSLIGETLLAEEGYVLWSEDGYVIYRIPEEER